MSEPLTDEELAAIDAQWGEAVFSSSPWGRRYYLDVPRLIDEVKRLQALYDEALGAIRDARYWAEQDREMGQFPPRRSP